MANYLYGPDRVELPDINTVWTDKERYPYAILVLNSDETYSLYLGTDIVYFPGTGRIMSEVIDYRTYLYAYGEWVIINDVYHDPNSSTEPPPGWQISGKIFWTSKTIQSSAGGEVYLEYSPPISVSTYTPDLASMTIGWLMGKRVAGTRKEPVTWITFSSDESFSIYTARASKNWNGALYYSTDTVTWNEWDGTTISSTHHRGKYRIYMRGLGNSTLTSYTSTPNEYVTLTIHRWCIIGSNVYCDGNIENLLDFNKVSRGEHPTMSSACYTNLFCDCAALVTPPELPATELSVACYMGMFRNCKSLVRVPELPAIGMKDWCYAMMFTGCENITSGPTELSVDNTSEWCYFAMFSRCNNLKTINKLPVTELNYRCYTLMYSDCTNIKLSETQTDEYQTPYRIPTESDGTTASDALTDMFANTGGVFTGTPEINKTYYLHSSNSVI